MVNLLTGGPAAGRALAAHPRVDKVSFTGSSSVGHEIVQASSGNLKRVTLELGGKAPSIIARDADIDRAVEGNLHGALLNSGQVCAAYTRLYVDRRRADEFTEKLAAAASSLRLGPGLDPRTQIGPLVTLDHLDRVDSHVRTGPAKGAELVTGGGRADHPGFFYPPTVFAGVTDTMTIAREEIFGPVLPVLAASLWTRDLGPPPLRDRPHEPGTLSRQRGRVAQG